MKTEKLKSEKITSDLRNSIYNHFYDKYVDQKKIQELINILVGELRNAYFQEFTGGDKDIIKVIEENSSLFGTYNFGISPEDFGIKLSEEDLRKLRYDKDDIYMWVPDIKPEDLPIDQMFNQILDNQGIREGITALYQEIIDLIIKKIDMLGKYINYPFSTWRRSDSFCISCSTTRQLELKYPEVYKVYEELKQKYPTKLGNENSKEKLIEDLRSKLGFI
jgi:hypothetical protein